MANAKKNQTKIPRHVVLALLGGLAFFLWTASTLMLILAMRLIPQSKIPDVGAFSTVIFGGASIAIILFSLLIGGGALLGYQSLREIIKNDVEADTQKSVAKLEREMRGRIYLAVGLMTGTLYSDPTERKQSEKNKDYLAEAVWYCREAYKTLRTQEGNVRFTALNNFVYYSCLFHDGEVANPAMENYLLKKARILRDVSQERNFPDGSLTYCRAVLQFGKDAKEVGEAHDIAAALNVNGDLNDRQRKETTFYVVSLSKKRQEVTAS